MRLLLAVAFLLLFARTAHATTPIGDPPDASPDTRALHHRARLAESRGRHEEALSLFENGATTAPEPSARAMFLYEEARLLVGLQRTAAAFAVIDRLVAEPAHPRFGCLAPPPSATHLYQELAVRNGRELIVHALEHERQGRHVQAFEEARWSHEPLPPAIATHVGRVFVHLAQRGGILFEGLVYGPADHFECAAAVETPRPVRVGARAESGATAEGTFLAQPGPPAVLELAFPPAPSSAAAPPTPRPDEPPGNYGLVYLSAGFGGGFGTARGQSNVGEGHVGASFWLLFERGPTSLLLTSNGLLGGATDGLMLAGRWRVEVGRRFALHDTRTTGNALFLRGGLEGRLLLLGTDAVQAGAIDLPTVSAGYAFFRNDPVAVELGFRGGLTLLGRYATDAGSRNYEVAPTYGPFASVHLGPVHVDGIIARSSPLRTPHTPVDYANATTCVSVIVLGLCVETTYARAAVRRGDAFVASDALYVGGTAVIALDSTGVGFLANH